MESFLDEKGVGAIRLRHVVNGAASLSEVVAMLDAIATRVERLIDAGWELEQPIIGDYGLIKKVRC